MMPPSTNESGSRDDSIDVMRALAILGMFVVHAVLVLGSNYPREGIPAVVLWLCDGRAAATFVTLSGIGVARLAAKYKPEIAAPILRRRAAILAILGVLNLIIWPGDILRVYGIALLAAPMILRWSIRTRALVSIGLVVLFPGVAWVFDWTRHWNLDTLMYIGVWTLDGFVRNLLFDGFRPVLPWLSFFLVGTIVADWDRHDTRTQRWLMVFGATATGLSLGLSVFFDRLLVRYAPQIDALTREGVVGTTSLPPMPLFMISAFGTTSFLLGAVGALLPHVSQHIVQPLAATGRRALTWYLLHVVFLMSLYTSGFNNFLSAPLAIAAGIGMFAVAVTWSYLKRNTTGVIEKSMRQLTMVKSWSNVVVAMNQDDSRETP